MSFRILFLLGSAASDATWYRAFVATGNGADPMTGCGCYNNVTCNKGATDAGQCGADTDPVQMSQAHDCLKCRCNWRNPKVDWVANTKGNSGTMGNGGGYPLEHGNACVGGGGKQDVYDNYMKWALAQQGRRLEEDMADNTASRTESSAQPSGPIPTAGKWASLDIPSPDGTVLKNQVVSVAIGHGLFDGECQQCYIVQMPKEISGNPEDRYMALMQVDVRAWSFEFTQNAQCYLDQSICYGGGCKIPNAMKVDCNDIINNSIPQSLTTTGVQKWPGDNPEEQTCAAAGDTCAANVFI